MPSLRVIEPGLFTTVQDLGRTGHSAIGVPPSGAFDALSLIAGNRLLNNPDHAAALECTLLGPTVTLDRDAWVCLTGAPCPNARIAASDFGRPLPWCEPTRIHAGELMRFGGLSDGARSYLCVSGGLDVPLVLNSRSTLATAGFGGHHGRPLRKDDTIPLTTADHRPRSPSNNLHNFLRSQLGRRTLRIVPSLHAERFPADALDRLTSAEFSVGDQSNRVGLRLNGPAIPPPDLAGSFDSEPTVTGGVQIPGDGQPIILGVDRPTTGGYPLLACVIRADLPATAMLRPRGRVRFEPVTLEEARRLSTDQRRTLDTLLAPCDDGADA
ncbi:MAG: biotin-dependent carboxyltransferase [Planctomycetota bacterium]|nr:MAG: biotin-dependent carboxyltransferase [Planctomycetota bacterium]